MFQCQHRKLAWFMLGPEQEGSTASGLNHQDISVTHLQSISDVNGVSCLHRGQRILFLTYMSFYTSAL